jgi:ABC-type uncharacterized transport system permease subunit
MPSWVRSGSRRALNRRATGWAGVTLPPPVADTVLIHPNRDKPEAKATKAAVVLLLLTSAALIAIVTVGGWAKLQGAQMVSIGYVLVYILMTVYVSRWNRGVLPVAAALAILFAVVAAVAGPAWFDRDKTGFENPALDPAILGLLTLIIVPVQVLLIAFAMRGFQQQWNVEVEVTTDEADRYRRGDMSEHDLHAAQTP